MSLPKIGLNLLSNYSNFEQIGEGAYGYVYSANSFNNIDNNNNINNKIAIKRLIFNKYNNGVFFYFLLFFFLYYFIILYVYLYVYLYILQMPLNTIREIQLLKKLSTTEFAHKNIIKLIDIVTSKGCDYIGNFYYLFLYLIL